MQVSFFLLIPLSKFRPRNPDSGNCSFYRQDADVLSNSFMFSDVAASWSDGASFSTCS